MSESEPVIRVALEEDCEDMFEMLAGLAVAVGDTSKFISSVDDLRLYGFGEAPLFDALVAECNERVLGLCLFFYTYSSWLGRPGIYVQDLFVDETKRGSGLGRRLLQKAAAIGRDRGANHLRLSVDHINTPAQKFYESLGFRRRDDEHIFQADGATFGKLAGTGGTV